MERRVSPFSRSSSPCVAEPDEDTFVQHFSVVMIPNREDRGIPFRRKSHLRQLQPLFDAQNDSRSKTEVIMEVTGSEIRNVVELRAQSSLFVTVKHESHTQPKRCEVVPILARNAVNKAG